MECNSMSTKHYVYIIGENVDSFCGSYSGFIKVGMSNNPKTRMKDLQCANPRRLNFILIIELESKFQSELIECAIHTKMAHHLEKNEWFKYNKYTHKWIKRIANAGFEVIHRNIS